MLGLDPNAWREERGARVQFWIALVAAVALGLACAMGAFR